MLKIGQGLDAHRFKEGRKLIIGGVDIPFERGLDGHSDADVLLHAVADALLGALGLGDIGMHFPDTDKQYKGVSSLVLLESVKRMMDERCALLNNIDATIVAQRPKMMHHIPAMKNNIADVLKVSAECINIKATTTEKMGFTGREEGISALAVALISCEK